MNPLPFPRAQLADCLWLPRIIAKARLIQADKLPPEYVARFCAPDSVDEHFLRFFQLTKDDITSAVAGCGSDEEVTAWFRARPGVNSARIAEWNTLAENLGKPGFPMAQRFADVLPTMYRHLDPAKVRSIFDLLETDEREN